jgi:hypothetical protein
VAFLPSVVEGYLQDLRGLLGRDPERARELLAKLLGPIRLRRDGDNLVAEMISNLPAPLEMGGEALYNFGSMGPSRDIQLAHRGGGGRLGRRRGEAYGSPSGPWKRDTVAYITIAS